MTPTLKEQHRHETQTAFYNLFASFSAASEEESAEHLRLWDEHFARSSQLLEQLNERAARTPLIF